MSHPDIHPNLKLLSHSSEVVLHRCSRKYELYKLLPAPVNADDNIDFAFGTAVGAGTQEYFVSHSLSKAMFAAFLAWPTFIDNEDGQKKKKTFWHALYAVEKFILLAKTELAKYELAVFDGRPSAELGFSIDFGNGYFYRGVLDMLLLDRDKKELIVYEGKTTGSYNVHEATYKHSGQSLGYSVVVDTIAKMLGLTDSSSYSVKYCVYKTTSYEWEIFPFKKSHHQRALWIRNIMLDVQYIEERAAEQYFPMRGESCFDFFRPCPYFGFCEMSNEVIFRGKEIELVKDKEGKYTFKYSLKELIEAQLAKHEMDEVGV